MPGLADPSDGVAKVREKMAPLHGHPLAEGTRVERLDSGGVPCAWVTARGAGGDERALVHFHGGAFVSCSLDDYLFYGEFLSRATGARVLEVGYRLAPEHPFPAALDDCVAAWEGALQAGLAPERGAFVGDSCGGGLAVAAMLRLRDRGLPQPAAGIGMCGWFDLEAGGESARRPRGVDPFLDPEWLRRRGRDYLGSSTDPRHPLASPIHADLDGLPPLLLQVGEVDITRDDAVRLAARAAAAGVGVTLEVWPGMIHGWHGLGEQIPEVRRALAHIGAFVREQIPDRDRGSDS